MSKHKITLDLRSDRERQHHEYMERQRQDEIRLADAKAARAAQFAEEAKAETVSVYLSFEDQDDLVTIWRQCLPNDAYPTLIEASEPECSRGPAYIGILRLDLSPERANGARWFFRDRVLDLEKLEAEKTASARHAADTLRREIKAREEAQKFTGCGDPTYRAGGSR